MAASASPIDRSSSASARNSTSCFSVLGYVVECSSDCVSTCTYRRKRSRTSAIHVTTRSSKRGNHRRMIARSDVFLDGTGYCPCCERCRRENVIEPPADVPLSHVPPWRPPRKEAV